MQMTESTTIALNAARIAAAANAVVQAAYTDYADEEAARAGARAALGVWNNAADEVARVVTSLERAAG